MDNERLGSRRLDRAVRALETDLLYMRKGAGFTANRLVRAPELSHVLGGANETFSAQRERFVSAIESLRDPDASLLLAVYGLEPATAGGSLLFGRRQAYGHQVGRGVDTVADRESAALRRLRSQLVTGWYPKSPLPVRVPLSHNGIVLESVAVRTVVLDRKWIETTEHHRFFAAFDEADFLAISSSVPALVVAEPPFTAHTKQVGASYARQFWHAEPMRRGESYDLKFRARPEDEDPNDAILTEESRAFHEPVRYATLEVEFQGRVPVYAWFFERLSYFERPGSPFPEWKLEVHDNKISRRFVDQYGGLFFGLAWSWGS